MQVFRSTFGRVITVLVGLVMALALVVFARDFGIASALGSVPLAVLLVYGSAVMFWLPRVEVDDGGVRIVNLIRSHYISWGAIDRVDTRYALAVFVGQKKYTAWGAPAPGRHAAFFATKDQGQHLPDSTYLAGTVRPGDLVTSESGAAAAVIRNRWEKTQGQDLISSVNTAWHFRTIAALITLTLLAGLAF